MANGADCFVAHMETCVDHVELLEWARHPSSPGGTLVTDQEWEEAIEHARNKVRRQAVGLVLVEQVRNNVKHRGLEYAIEVVGLEKSVSYSVKRHLGLVGPRGGPRTKKEAPYRATNSEGLERKPTG